MRNGYPYARTILAVRRRRDFCALGGGGMGMCHEGAGFALFVVLSIHFTAKYAKGAKI